MTNVETTEKPAKGAVLEGLLKKRKAMDDEVAGAADGSTNNNEDETPFTCTKDGDHSADISQKGHRKIRIGSYKKKVTVSIREFYQKGDDEEWLHGKKGITLTKEQWEEVSRLCKSGAIDRAIAEVEDAL